MPKVLKSTWSKLWCSSACKKSTSSLTFFFTYCKGIAKLLFWQLWECFTIPIKNYTINLWETFMLIFMQKINFNYSFFFQMLQRNSKLVILGNLDMPYHTHLKWLYQFEETFEVHLQAKNPFYQSRFPYDIPKILKIYNFGCFGHALLRTPEVTLSACRKSTSSPTLFRIYCKDRQTSYFGYFEHSCLNTLKMIAWTCRK